MMDINWDDIEPEFSNVRLVSGGFRKQCANAEYEHYFTARSERDQFCPEHTGHNAVRDYSRVTKPFAGFDGEGEGDGQAHVYNFMGMGEASLHTDHDLFWSEALEWIYNEFLQDPDRIIVGFCLKYDEARVFRTLPSHRAHKLMFPRYSSPDKSKPFAVDTDPSDSHNGKRWLVRRMYGGKLLEFKPKPCDCYKPSECKHVKNLPWARIQDVWECFNRGSFLEVIEKDPEMSKAAEAVIVRRGKALRGTRMNPKALQEYNAAETKLLAMAMERVRKALTLVGIRPAVDGWYGLGHFGQLWMDKQEFPPRVPRKSKPELYQRMSDKLLDAGKASYFGPYFEDISCGIVEGECHEYDLNGAFQAILADMPCMECGWSYHRADREGQPGPLAGGYLRLMHATVTGPNPEIKSVTDINALRESGQRYRLMPLGSAMYRRKGGGIYSPVSSTGWHWQHELDARTLNSVIETIEVSEWWDKAPCDHPKPFRNLGEMFRLRRTFQPGSIEERLFKYLPDTVYGKLAETRPSAKYGNLVYASYVTSKCRELVLRAIASHQDGIHGLLKITSDGFFMRNEHAYPERLPIGDGLGQWKHDVHCDLTNFETGLWWSRATEKTSGIHKTDMPALRNGADEIFRKWDRSRFGLPGDFPEIVIPVKFKVTTLSEASWPDMRNWSKAGMVVNDRTETRKYEPQRHRGILKSGIVWDDEFKFFRSFPLLEGARDQDGNLLESEPYRGKDNQDDDISNRPGFNPDGPNLPELMQEIKGE